MSDTTKHGWTILDRDAGVLYREYEFSRGAMATTLAWRTGVGDELHVMSPGCATPTEAFKELDEFGRVTSLLTCNSYHWFGQRSWRAHYPDALSYAPEGALARLRSKTPELSWKPLPALEQGPRARVYELPGLKLANALVTIATPSGAFWYPSDFIANISRLPTNWLFRFVMQKSDSAPGYKQFKLAQWLMIKDKTAAREAMLTEVRRSPMRAVVPAHGRHVQGADLLADTERQLARMK